MPTAISCTISRQRDDIRVRILDDYWKSHTAQTWTVINIVADKGDLIQRNSELPGGVFQSLDFILTILKTPDFQLLRAGRYHRIGFGRNDNRLYPQVF